MLFRMFALTFLLAMSTPAFAQKTAPQKTAPPKNETPKTAPGKSEAPKLETNLDKTSYVIGFNFGRDILKQGLDANPKALAAGVAAALAGEKMTLTPEEIQAAFKALETDLQKKSEEIAAKNLEDGKKFLAANGKKEGVKVTKSGLQYIVIKEGTGAIPTLDTTVTTHYRGRLIDGSVFDNSYEGEAPTESDMPASFGVTQVIKGWTEALQLMKVGARYRLFLPSELAYGENGPPGIGPNSVLVFDIELIGAKDNAADGVEKKNGKK